ncbi:hypothetical protein MNBD_GAMMA08-963 [hydrothermal vent metagenome]|uniref:DUF4129 domain-containing protein n=1 Tax=hydrothermal vent metagenome TaxID=652676 RepID=A0A3B0XFD3_9ZZZZ
MSSKYCFFSFLLFINFFTNNVIANDQKKEVVVDARPEVVEARGDIENSKLIITEIIEKEPFVNVTEEKLWRFKEEDQAEVDVEGFELLNAIMAFMAMIIEASLWLLMVLIIYLLYRHREYWLNLIQGKAPRKSTPDLPNTLFGLDITPENLPDDIEFTAKALWRDKYYREAVSLLYRGSLASLFKLYDFDLPVGSTEHDCIRQLELNFKKQNDTAEKRINKFKQLTSVWVDIAYGHKHPDDVVFDDLCENWNQYFSTDLAVISK